MNGHMYANGAPKSIHSVCLPYTTRPPTKSRDHTAESPKLRRKPPPSMKYPETGVKRASRNVSHRKTPNPTCDCIDRICSASLALSQSNPRKRRALPVLHRRADAGNDIGGRAGDLFDQRGDLLAGERVDVDLELFGLGEIGRVLHRGIERAPQRLDPRRRRPSWQDRGTAERHRARGSSAAPIARGCESSSP